MRKEYDSTRSGLYALGYITNSATYLDELKKLLGVSVSASDLDANIAQAYINGQEMNYQYDISGSLQTGDYDESKTCRYAINTGYTVSSNPSYPAEEVYALFSKDQYGKWTGVKFNTLFKISNMLTAYRFGRISFKNFSEANSFITTLESYLLPGETWKFKGSTHDDYRPKTTFDILESYLQYIFEKLSTDHMDSTSKNYGKIIFSLNNQYAMFNTGLLNRFAQDICLVGEVYGDKNSNFTFSNPQIVPSKVDLIKAYGFSVQSLTPYPDVAEFFQKLDDIIYDTEIEIDLSADRLSHIIEDGARRNRFAAKYTAMYEKGDLPAITSTLETAIKNAEKIAKRNYKYVVPQYRSARQGQPGKIQFLMPIFLDRQYGERPDFALVLNIETMPDGYKFYTPETILELSWAYNNARVICKPEDTWLNPNTINSVPIELSVEEDLENH